MKKRGCGAQFIADIIVICRYGPPLEDLVTRSSENGTTTFFATPELRKVKLKWVSVNGRRHRVQQKKRKDALTAEDKLKRRHEKMRQITKATGRMEVRILQSKCVSNMVKADASEMSCFANVKLSSFASTLEGAQQNRPTKFGEI